MCSANLTQAALCPAEDGDEEPPSQSLLWAETCTRVLAIFPWVVVLFLLEQYSSHAAGWLPLYAPLYLCWCTGLSPEVSSPLSTLCWETQATFYLRYPWICQPVALPQPSTDESISVFQITRPAVVRPICTTAGTIDALWLPSLTGRCD